MQPDTRRTNVRADTTSSKTDREIEGSRHQAPARELELDNPQAKETLFNQAEVFNLGRAMDNYLFLVDRVVGGTA